MSTLDGFRVLSIEEAWIASSGGWRANLTLSSSALPPLAPSTLTIGRDLALRGRTTFAAFEDHKGAGGRVRVIHEGGAGWYAPLARAGSYTADDGVRLSVVLGELAALAGETIEQPSDVMLPKSYTWRARGRVADVLAELVLRGAIPTWRVDPATGRTRFDAWPAGVAADGFARVTKRNLEAGRRTAELDDRVAALLPGNTLEGKRIERLILRETSRNLVAEVYE